MKQPRQVSFSSGKTVSYQYDAVGTKLRMSTSTGETRDYVGPFQYLNGTLFEVSHGEGRVTPNGATYTYEYFHKDHLGNVRAVVSQAGMSQWIDYDPWGLELSGLSSGSSTNRLRFNGKEAVAELGNGLLDFGARLNDVTIGRWFMVDPLAELDRRWSPYRFGYDNPLRVIDPDGRFEFSNGYTTDDSKYITGSMEFNGVYQNSIGGTNIAQPNNVQVQADPPSKKKQTTSSTSLEQQPTPGLIDKEGRMIYPDGLAPVIKDGIEPSFFIEGQVVGGVLAKPLGLILRGLLGRFTGQVAIVEAEAQSSNILNLTSRQLQAKFKHASDFGVVGNYSPANAAKFSSAINQHTNSIGVQMIQGTYRGQNVIHYLNPTTGVNVISTPSGQFISGWKLGLGQLQGILNNGTLW